jgi:hypothetical protein
MLVSNNAIGIFDEDALNISAKLYTYYSQRDSIQPLPRVSTDVKNISFQSCSSVHAYSRSRAPATTAARPGTLLTAAAPVN